MRSTEALLLQAELMNSTPEHVYNWFQKRSESANGKLMLSGDDLEEALLTRNSTLINLGLARYGSCARVVHQLFSSNTHANECKVNSYLHHDLANTHSHAALRLAALSNRSVAAISSIGGTMPQHSFDIAFVSSPFDSLREFISSAGDNEIAALFGNPTIDVELLARLYEKSAPFELLAEERWQHLIRASYYNARLRGIAASRLDLPNLPHSRMLNEAWNLAGRVPVTLEWANILECLLEKTVPTCYSIKNPTAVIERWNVPHPGDSEWLDTFGKVRLILARLYATRRINELRSAEDPALRCAYYQMGELSPLDMRNAYSHEANLFLFYALKNDSIWCCRETREVLRELSFVTPNHDLSSVFAFGHRHEELSSEHPEWFLEKSRERDVDSTLREFQATIKSIQETTNGIAVELDTMQARIVNMAFWVGAIGCAFYVIRSWL